MTNCPNTSQISDDLDLLSSMLDDSKSAPEIYQTTNYWKVYEKRIVPELVTQGLNDFRSRKPTTLHKFGATDPYPKVPMDLLGSRILNNRITRRVPIWIKILESIRKLQVSFIHRKYRQIINLYAGKSTGKPLDFKASLAGNPDDVITITNKPYPTSLLNFYLSYLYCSNFIDFQSVNTIVELGSGSGKQIEVLKNLHPDVCYVIFDIPPQLYVCEQYLKTVFPGSVVGYRETRNMRELPENRTGKIFLMANWDFPIVNDVEIDLFWNSASFQEMEPNVVSHYLASVNTSAKNVYLCEDLSGKKIASQQGESGVIQPVTIEDYRNGLENFELVDINNEWATRPSEISHSFWKNTITHSNH
jgi:putative sugar O-methyltransferase